MAEIRFLPNQLAQPDTVRLAEALAGAMADGVDLGPRGPHIRALGLAMEQEIDRLKQRLRSLEDTPGVCPARLEEIKDAVERICAFVEPLSIRASEYSY